MPKTIEISGCPVGPEAPCFIIAEACDNHLGDMETAREMVRQAKACGADAIKFQHHLPDEEMLREGVPMSDNFDMPLYEFLQRYALKLEDHYDLLHYCKELGIVYLCTPFSRKAAEESVGGAKRSKTTGSGAVYLMLKLAVLTSPPRQAVRKTASTDCKIKR